MADNVHTGWLPLTEPEDEGNATSVLSWGRSYVYLPEPLHAAPSAPVDAPSIVAKNALAAADPQGRVQWQKLQGGLGLFYGEPHGAVTLAAQEPGTEAAGATSLQSNAFVSSRDGRIAIDAAASDGDGAALLKTLQTLGLDHGAAFGALVSGHLPVDLIDEASNLVELKFVRPAYLESYAGAANSQGDAALRADDARALHGVDGTGITVGILSDSFNTRGGYATDVASGDLPGNVIVLLNGDGSSDEGRAMAQIVHDVAPGASIAFHTAWEGQANFAQGILDLSAISQVIVDDVFYFAEPFFQDGIIAQAVDAAVASGDVYFSAAGNQTTRSYESAFRDSGVTTTISGWQYRLHDFDIGSGVDTRQRITQSGDVSYILQWDQPFYSHSPGSGGATNDVDFFLFSTSGTLLASSVDDNLGGDPFEYMRRAGSGSYDLAIGLYTGAAPGLLKYTTVGGSFTVNEYATHSGTNTGHANAAGAIAVGAAAFYNTPEFGVGVPVAESFSSPGGVPILFDKDGRRLESPQIRDKTEITAPDGGNTTFFGSDTSRDADTLPNFFGTSAAAPHAAALAALMLDLAPTATPAQIEQALKDSAIDMGAAGFDRITGYGLVQAPAALGRIASSTAVTHGPDLDGDARSEILWHHRDGRVASWELNGAAVSEQALPTMGSGWRLIDAHGDFNGDGRSDVLWQNAGGAATLWEMNSGTVTPRTLQTAVPASHLIDGHGDYDGDGRAEVLWQHADGTLVSWQVNGASVTAQTLFSNVAAGWNIIAADADYNGDGRSDVLWRHNAGSVVVWQMNGTAIDALTLHSGVASSWNIADARGDYNGDGKTDVLWRNSDGTVVTWQINGGAVSARTLMPSVGASWRIVDGHGDYDGDGDSEILWQNTAGDVVAWEIGSGSVTGTTLFSGVASSWRVASGHDDYTGDGKADILWQNTNGALVLWEMNAASIVSRTQYAPMAAGWLMPDAVELGANLTGDAGVNTLVGTLARDTIAGGAGNDTLTGGGADDRFVFDAAPGAGNVDTLTDFQSGSDALLLSEVIFSSLPAGPLAAGSFVSGAGAAAADADDFILYDTSTGRVSYDSDGSGSASAVTFAILANNAALAATDVMLGTI